MSLFTYEKLYWAYLDCRKNKRKTINALDFEIDFENNLRELLCELKTRKYRPGRSIFFAVDQPSLREIFAADFRDRIIHHLLVSEFLPFFEARFIADSYACRPGKGTHGAVRRLRRYMKSFRKNDYYYGQFDIKGFFMSIDQNILFSMLKAKLEKEFRCDRQKLEEILWLSRMIIFHKPSENYVIKGDLALLAKVPPHKSLLHQKEERGLPIGNYSSQFFANVYLDELDQFVKRTLKCRQYIRYVDDFIILEKDIKKLKFLRSAIDEFLRKNLNAELNLKKCRIQPIERGIDFLGYFFKPDRIYVRRKVVKRYRNKLYPIAIGLRQTNLRSLLAMAHSYAGHFKHAR
jgi:retron-type reverse transcriptase